MTSTGASSADLPSLAGAAWLLSTETQAVFQVIEAAGFSARVVGGAVRNALFGRPVKDIDFATTAQPDEVMALAATAGLNAIPTGIDHGTVTVIVGHVPFEVTTLREDVETFGRHARVAFTGDWAADARRRDFTINALYCDAAGTVIDPLGGYPDLVAGQVRFIGDPHARIREDYLRILRFFRFHAEYGRAAVDVPSLDACVGEKAGLVQLSGERIRAELLRLLGAPGAAACIAVMAAHGILAGVLGASPSVDVFAHLARIEAEAGLSPEPILRLAALVLPAADPGELKNRLRLSSSEADRLLQLSRGIPGLAASMAAADARAAIYRHGADAFTGSLLLAWARSQDKVDDPGWRTLADLPSHWQPPVLPVRGADLIARGLLPGPRIGQVLAALEDWWVSDGFPSDTARIEVKLAQLLRGHGM